MSDYVVSCVDNCFASTAPVTSKLMQMFGVDARRSDDLQEINPTVRDPQELSVTTVRLQQQNATKEKEAVSHICTRGRYQVLKPREEDRCSGKTGKWFLWEECVRQA